MGGKLSAWIKQKRSQHLYSKKNLVGWISTLVWGEPDYIHWLKKSKVTLDSHILDVGSGGGELLSKLKLVGFKSLIGIDPFLEKDVDLGGVSLIKTDLDSLTDKFDFIMLNHSLEHMPDQQRVFKNLRRLINPKGTVLIRIPLVSSEAWKLYGIDWVQLDAPRHLYLHSVESVKHLAEQEGFSLEGIDYDSFAFQFWGSEQYKADIPLKNDARSFAVNPARSIFTTKKISEFEAQSQELNKQFLGDQACFYFRAP